MEKIELLAPAGDLEKLKIAVSYGADAVYFGGELFSLRAGAGNLSFAEMYAAISLSIFLPIMRISLCWRSIWPE